MDSASRQPRFTLDIDGSRVTVLGTAHVSRRSAEAVAELIDSGDYDAVAIELCDSRFANLQDPDRLARTDLFQVIRQGKAPMVMASLALGAFQQRLAEQFGIEPGAEMRMAMDKAAAAGLPLHLIDRDIGVTLKRVYRSVSWWQRLNLFAGLLASALTREKVEEADIERLKEGDMLDAAFSEFAQRSEQLYRPLIEERDRYMALKIYQAVQRERPRHLLAVVGAGHLKGIEQHLRALAAERPDAATVAARLAELEALPPRVNLWRWLPWLIVAVILAGFAIGFARSPALGWALVADWVIINGGLAALGAAIAGGHPLTVIGAFLAAPLTSLNPTIGAGMVTALIEVLLRKPTVADFSSLRHDLTHWKGWWRNHVSRVLLVFFFSTLGSAIGTYVAGFRIFDRLTG